MSVSCFFSYFYEFLHILGPASSLSYYAVVTFFPSTKMKNTKKMSMTRGLIELRRKAFKGKNLDTLLIIYGWKKWRKSKTFLNVYILKKKKKLLFTYIEVLSVFLSTFFSLSRRGFISSTLPYSNELMKMMKSWLNDNDDFWRLSWQEFKSAW